MTGSSEIPVAYGAAPRAAITVLFVTPKSEDFKQLRAMLRRPKWELYQASTLAEGFARLDEHRRISLVLCEQDLREGTWRQMLEHTGARVCPPLVIVTSQLADEQLWAEALNLGAYDVLLRPFQLKEVHRTLMAAWMRWQHGP